MEEVAVENAAAPAPAAEAQPEPASMLKRFGLGNIVAVGVALAAVAAVVWFVKFQPVEPVQCGETRENSKSNGGARDPMMDLPIPVVRAVNTNIDNVPHFELGTDTLKVQLNGALAQVKKINDEFGLPTDRPSADAPSPNNQVVLLGVRRGKGSPDDKVQGTALIGYARDGWATRFLTGGASRDGVFEDDALVNRLVGMGGRKHSQVKIFRYDSDHNRDVWVTEHGLANIMRTTQNAANRSDWVSV
jgi:hypothetical protein